MLTGLKDVDREILKYVDDKDLLRVCSIDKKTWNEVCDENFLKRRLSKYSEIEKFRLEKESYKQFFLRFIYYRSKMRDEYDFEYTDGDFKKQFYILSMYVSIFGLLTSSAKEGELSLVKYAAKKNMNYINDALAAAAGRGQLEIVKWLLNSGADIHFGTDQSLLNACYIEDIVMVKYLVERGADIHARDDWPLYLASKQGYFRIVKYLVERGADIHSNDDVALKIAERYGHIEIVNYLNSILLQNV